MKPNDHGSHKDELLAHLDSVFHGPAWHGAALLPTVRSLEFEGIERENGEGYSPWKVVLHCAYWKFVVRRWLTLQDEPPQFPRRPDDFPDLPIDRTPETWKTDLEFLEEEHRRLCETLAGFPSDRLHDKPPDSDFTYTGLVLGAAAHDVYHSAHVRNLGVVEFGMG
jgi:hypothetical protein